MRYRWMSAAVLLAATACNQQDPNRNMTANEVAEELAGVRIEPGLWEVTSRVVNVSAPNLPREVLTRMTGERDPIRNCITPEQAARPDANFLAAQRDANCTYRDFSMRGGQLRGSTTCTGGGMPGTMSTTMEGRYGPQSYDMTMRMETAGMPQGADMTIETRVTGRRIGECPPGGAEEQ